GIEQLMIMVPNFQPRRSGIVINNYFNWEGCVKNCNCNIVNVRNGCAICGGTSFDTKLNIYEVEYKDLVRYCFGKIKNYYLKDRLKFLTNNFKGEAFLNPKHKERFYHVIYGGFAPNSETAQVLSKALGSRTVMSGSISRGKNDPSQSLQMME